MDRLPFLWMLLTSLALAGPLSASEQTLRVHGSNTIGERLGPALAEAWLRDAGYTRIERFAPAHDEITVRGTGPDGRIDVEMKAHGTSTGFADLLAGRADLAMASRPVAASERERGRVLGALDSAEQEAVLALDGIAIIVHPDNPLRALSLAQLRAIFSGSERDWRSLRGASGPIVVHARDANSGTWDTFRSLVLGEVGLRADARRHESTLELSRAVAADRDAIGFVGLAGIGAARAVPVADAGEAILPTPFAVAVEDYALSRRLYLYRAESASPLARDFVEYSLSDAGQAAVEGSGFISQRVGAWNAALRSDAPDEYRALVQSSERLSLNFRFGSGSHLLDSKAQRDLDRLASFMQDGERRDRALILLGFADASETVPYLALTLSVDRVDFITRELERRGVVVQRSRGLGGAAPVASNEAPEGRRRNRRVEVWLGPPQRVSGRAAQGAP
jgi:phosphate transport system substrate-binding protein